MGVFGFWGDGVSNSNSQAVISHLGSSDACALVFITRLGFSDHIDRSDSVHEGSAVPVARHRLMPPQLRVKGVDTGFEGSAPAHPPCTVSCCDMEFFLWSFILVSLYVRIALNAILHPQASLSTTGHHRPAIH